MRFCSIAVLLSGIVGINPAGAQPVIEEGVVYGRAGDAELQLDIARPSGDGPFPAIVFIHGGGWHLGDRHGYRSLIEAAARRGYVGVTVSYRLMVFDEANRETTTATDRFPAQVHDVKAAVRWMRAHADQYRIDPQRIGATGRSAGGHLALMLGLTDTDAGLEGHGGNPGKSSRVQAVVNVFGPADLKACYEDSTVAWIFRLLAGGTPQEAADVYRQASPVTYVSSDDPPVLTLQGSEDQLVPLAQAESLHKKLESAGVTHTLSVFEGQGHGFGGVHRKRELDLMWSFFDQHLRHRKPS